MIQLPQLFIHEIYEILNAFNPEYGNVKSVDKFLNLILDEDEAKPMREDAIRPYVHECVELIYMLSATTVFVCNCVVALFGKDTRFDYSSVSSRMVGHKYKTVHNDSKNKYERASEILQYFETDSKRGCVSDEHIDAYNRFKEFINKKVEDATKCTT